MKITNEISKQIYEIAKDPKSILTNREIGEKFGIDEATVRYHIKKWESKVHQIAKTDEKAAIAIANYTIDVYKELYQSINNVKLSIKEARDRGVSPEKLAPLFNSWLKGLELASERLSEISRSPQVNVQINQELSEIKALFINELCDGCKAKMKGRLHELAGK